SALDQYLMGLRDASEVPPVFLVRGPSGTDPNPSRAPQSGVAFSGTRKDVSMADVVAALGPRNPPGAPWLKPFRRAVGYGTIGNAAPDALEKLERIRAAWPAFFSQGTDRRGSVDPDLN